MCSEASDAALHMNRDDEHELFDPASDVCTYLCSHGIRCSMLIIGLDLLYDDEWQWHAARMHRSLGWGCETR